MPPVIKELERFARVAPLGVRFRDTTSGMLIGDGLRVVVYPSASPALRTPAIVNRSSTWVGQQLPGLRVVEAGAGDDAYWATVPLTPFVVEVVDLAGRFLPFTFAADLPVRGLFAWDCPALTSPLSPLSPLSPPESMGAVPLFSSATRSTATGMAAIRAELRDPVTDAPAAWAVITAEPDGAAPAIGIADEEGRVVVFLPYPEPIDAIPGASPPSGPPLVDQAWSVALRVQYTRVTRPPAIADLCHTLQQPPATLWSDFGHGVPLTAAMLRYGRDLVLRSFDPVTGAPLPVLHVTP
jgi:hypothetical protein